MKSDGTVLAQGRRVDGNEEIAPGRQHRTVVRSWCFGVG